MSFPAGASYREHVREAVDYYDIETDKTIISDHNDIYIPRFVHFLTDAVLYPEHLWETSAW